MKVFIEYRHEGVGNLYADKQREAGEYPGALLWNGKDSVRIKCCRPRCNGYYDLTFKVMDFAESGEKERTGSMLCRGSETSPKGRRVYRCCCNFLAYRLFRSDSSPQSGAGWVIHLRD